MKKRFRFGFIFVSLLLLLAMSLFSCITLAQEAVAPGLPSGVGEVPGAAQIEKGQQTYEQYTTAENKSAYLAQQWGVLIGKARIIGPVHNFLSSHQLIFKIFFNYPYELSFTFFFVLFIWFVFVFKVTKIVKSTGLLKKPLVLPVVLIFTVVFAQIGLFNLIARGIINIMFLSDAWWVRLIVFILASTVIVALSILSNYLSKYFKTQEELRRQGGLERTSREFVAFERGVREGQSMTRNLG